MCISLYNITIIKQLLWRHPLSRCSPYVMVPKCGLWSLYAITQKRPGDDRQSRGNRQISFCWQLRDHTASVVAILRTISTISSHPDQCTTSRGISDQMLDEVQLCCCCTCLCHLYLYLSLPYMLVLVNVCIIWTCTVPSASALPILCYPSLSIPQSHMAGTNYCNTAIPH